MSPDQSGFAANAVDDGHANDNIGMISCDAFNYRALILRR